jgi:hypothetical protein
LANHLPRLLLLRRRLLAPLELLLHMARTACVPALSCCRRRALRRWAADVGQEAAAAANAPGRLRFPTPLLLRHRLPTTK